MRYNFRRIFAPTPDEQAKDRERYMKLHRELAKKKGCSTCGNIRHVISYPGFVMGEENECTVGLECDMVLFTVKNCPQWADRCANMRGAGDD